MTETGAPLPDLRSVAATAAESAGGLDAGLLDDFVAAAERAATRGGRLTRNELNRYRARGADAAAAGVALRALVDLYLTAAWRLWPLLPAVAAVAGPEADPGAGAEADPAPGAAGAVVRAGEAVLRAADDAVAAVTEGFQLARRGIIRREEAARREFVDDLLVGGSDPADLIRRAAGYGLDLSGPHAVAAVRADRPFDDGSPVAPAVESSVLGRQGDAGVLVASKEGLLVVVYAAPDREAVRWVAGRLAGALGPPDERIALQRRTEVGHWLLGLGRPGTGATGVRASFEEARAVLDLARRLDLGGPVVDAADLLVYQVLLRDRPAITDLVTELLSPLLAARGGAEPLLATLRAYFAAGGNSAAAARALHLSVRAVTYRLARVRRLTGHDPADPEQRYALQTAVLGARLLGWPADLP